MENKTIKTSKSFKNKMLKKYEKKDTPKYEDSVSNFVLTEEAKKYLDDIFFIDL